MNDIDDNAIVDEVAVDAKTAMELVTNEQVNSFYLIKGDIFFNF